MVIFFFIKRDTLNIENKNFDSIEEQKENTDLDLITGMNVGMYLFTVESYEIIINKI